jgi:hypothetical protein
MEGCLKDSTRSSRMAAGVIAACPHAFNEK